MSLLSFSGVAFRYLSGDPPFEGASFAVNPGDRIAVVGPNGAGKSTLLQILAGVLEPARGSVTRRQQLAISVADQDLTAAPGECLFEFAFRARPPLAALRDRLRRLELRLSDPVVAADYADRIDHFQELGGFAAEAEVEKMLAGLGFSAEQSDLVVARLSGGERNRASLARALAADADLLILDEPTNHLDVAARQWLEGALSSRAGACAVTSHDRAFLRAFARCIVEIDRGKVRVFEGGYDEYRRRRGLLDRQAWAAYDGAQRRKQAAESAARRRDEVARRVAATPDGIRDSKDHYARKAAKVQRTGRILRERVAVCETVEKPWEEQRISELSFDSSRRSGDLVLVANAIGKRFGARMLFTDLTLNVRRGDRLIIAGPNGCGKTTLMNVLRGVLQPDAGRVRLGANVDLACVTQERDDLDLERTPLELCGPGFNSRTLLACLKLRPDCLNRPLRELSAGERTKVSLARVLNSHANLLMLDEPTNHLEIEAQEALEQALRVYSGALVLISHDRAFVESLGPDIITIALAGVSS